MFIEQPKYDKEKLRTFQMPLTRVDVKHACPTIEEFCKEYWTWTDGRWEIRADWLNNGKWVTCRHCETGHAWNALYEAAQLFGFGEKKDAHISHSDHMRPGENSFFGRRNC
jgi:hypothetical protein